MSQSESSKWDDLCHPVQPAPAAILLEQTSCRVKVLFHDAMGWKVCLFVLATVFTSLCWMIIVLNHSVCLQVKFEEYDPVSYTSPGILAKPRYADEIDLLNM